MKLASLPATASWTHVGARTGFEVLFTNSYRLRGRTSAREGTSTWFVGYDIEVDDQWRTTHVRAVNSTTSGDSQVVLERDSDNRWTVNGVARPDLDGCQDVDFESSAVTNTLPIHRLPFDVGQTLEAPAAFVRADDLSVERLSQRYTLLTVAADGPVFHYESATFDFACELRFDPAGLVLDYPGIAVRHA